MMNQLTFGALVVALLVALGSPANSQQHQMEGTIISYPDVDQAEWEAYKLEWAKNYDNPAIEAEARMNFVKNKRYIEQFNGGRNQTGHTFELKLNQFSDMAKNHGLSHQRRSSMRVESRRRFNRGARRSLVHSMLRSSNSRDRLPKEVDWSKDPSRVSSVKDQGGCGAGWAFATVGLLEGQEKVQVNKSLDKVVDLSAQELVDCITGVGCHAGSVHWALQQIHGLGGIMAEADYPYVDDEGRDCKFDESKSFLTVQGPNHLPSWDEGRLMATLASYGPVAARIDAEAPTFVHYSKGVYNDPDCGEYDIDSYHGVLIVGYGTDPKGGDYWLVKNSWGPKWGEQGYVRIARNGNNICLLTTYPLIADF